MDEMGKRANGGRERAVLVAVQLPSVSDLELSDSLSELDALARTAGADVLGSLVQKRGSFNPATVLGKGKVEQVREAVSSAGATLVLFNNELTEAQVDRLQSALGARVVGRTALILDIFAQHAHTSEGRAQVELAQLSYLLPRIRGKGLELSRLGGGIGTRGPGETRLESDRREIHRRMRKLNRDLAQMESVRRTQRKRRGRAGLPSISLVGYTNSGKSSLLNHLTGASVTVEDQLFSTLDSTTRRLSLPDGQRVVVSDTVGFIRELPHELVAAFRSTLEVVGSADVLLHVVDSTREEFLAERMSAVDEVLIDLAASQVPRVVAFNKIDLVEPPQRAYLERAFPDGVLVSALTGEGVRGLLERAAGRLSGYGTVTVSVPAARGDVISSLYRDGAVLERELEEDTVVITVSLPRENIHRYADYLVDNTNNTQ
ncbi:MAG: GTPase HflX [Actinobacteria bacterium]|nr:GTPase HflX [Actinomycetota bacterium]MBU4240541.1 GTPase HflX [Actinomycetota bacterium]MBU4302136.1 GTPase HflX [Actinomycetota bacterium]MBU4386816.1 GTPase HflX [Actinomycetota bacterium]MBU4490000.1 GTPase HflX [Actinomycetota bacterium]